MMSLEELKQFIQQSTTPLKPNPKDPTPLNTPLFGMYFKGICVTKKLAK
jgi:hypothetical protein